MCKARVRYGDSEGGESVEVANISCLPAYYFCYFHPCRNIEACRIAKITSCGPYREFLCKIVVIIINKYYFSYFDSKFVPLAEQKRAPAEKNDTYRA